MTTPPFNENMVIETTGKQEPKPQPKPKVRYKAEIPEGSRLSALMATLPELEAQKHDAEEKLKDAKQAIQSEVVNLDGLPQDFDVVDIPADPFGAFPAYTMSVREGAWRLNTERMKSESPETYVEYAERGDPYLELKRVNRNRVKRS